MPSSYFYISDIWTGTECRRAKDLVQQNMELLHKVAALLLENEQVDGEELQAMIFEAQTEAYIKEDEPSVSLPYREPVPA